MNNMWILESSSSLLSLLEKLDFRYAKSIQVLILQPFTSQSHMICSSFVSVLQYETPLTGLGPGGMFPPGSRLFAKNFGSNKGTQSKLSDFS